MLFCVCLWYTRWKKFHFMCSLGKPLWLKWLELVFYGGLQYALSNILLSTLRLWICIDVKSSMFFKWLDPMSLFLWQDSELHLFVEKKSLIVAMQCCKKIWSIFNEYLCNSLSATKCYYSSASLVDKSYNLCWF